MSVNKYDPNSKTLTALSGQRVWVGTKADRAAAIANHTMPNNVLVCITDDEDDTFTDQVTKDDPRAVTSGGVYDETKAIKDRAFTPTLGTSVDLQTYDYPNWYTFLEDGYVMGYAVQDDEYIGGYVSDAANHWMVYKYTKGGMAPVYVRKGMKMCITGHNGTYGSKLSISFIPFVY